VNIGYEWSISPKELEAVVGLEVKVREENVQQLYSMVVSLYRCMVQEVLFIKVSSLFCNCNNWISVTVKSVYICELT
jgi:hypothetical protein